MQNSSKMILFQWNDFIPVEEKFCIKEKKIPNMRIFSVFDCNMQMRFLVNYTTIFKSL